jgi:6-phosphofructokinase
MEGEGTLKSCQTDLRKYDHMANSKYKSLHLPPLHDDVESTSRTTFFKAMGDDTGWLSDASASCASTTSTLKSDIIEAWKRMKKNH